MKSLIGNDRPINIVAARVVGRGEHYEIEHKDKTGVVSPTPLPTIPFVGKPEDNLTGKVIGDIKVVGFFGKRGKGKGKGRWVVRCACGNYCIKTTPALKTHGFMCCPICDKREHFKRLYEWSKTGVRPPSRMAASKRNAAKESEA